MKKLNVKPVSKIEVEENWNVQLPPGHLNHELFVRCNIKGEVKWDSTLLYTKSELEKRGNYSIFGQTLYNLPDLSSINFKKLRVKNKHTLKYVESCTGISINYLSKLENGDIGEPLYNIVKILLDFYSNKFFIK